MTEAIMVLAVSLGLAAAPPAAPQMAANSAATAGDAHSSARAPAPTAPAAAGEKVYCTSGTITGSRVSKQECKTKSEWKKDGVDIDELTNSSE